MVKVLRRGRGNVYSEEENAFFTAKVPFKVVVNNFVNPIHLFRDPGTARNPKEPRNVRNHLKLFRKGCGNIAS